MNDDQLSHKFGLVVKRLRLEAGMSQERFADICNLHRTYIGTIERGEKLVTIGTANKLAIALKIPLSKLFLLVEETVD